MSAQMKDVVAAGVSFEADEFKNDKTMIKKLPAELKHKILRYLKEPEPDTVADMPLIPKLQAASTPNGFYLL